MQKQTIKRIALALAAVGCTALAGCGTFNVGEEEFACSGMPGSSYCHSARDVYQTSEKGIVPSPMRSDARNEDCADCVYSEDVNPELKRLAEGASNDSNKTLQAIQVKGDEVINNYVAPAMPTDPVPIRTPAQVMRIWVGPYVDTNGDLVAPGIVYTEIEPRRWIYPDDANGGNSRSFTPLQATGSWSTKPKSPAAARDGYNALERFNKGQLGSNK